MRRKRGAGHWRLPESSRHRKAQRLGLCRKDREALYCSKQGPTILLQRGPVLLLDEDLHNLRAAILAKISDTHHERRGF